MLYIQIHINTYDTERKYEEYTSHLSKHVITIQDVLEEYEERVKSRGTVLKIDPACLRWTPFVPPAPPGPSQRQPNFLPNTSSASSSTLTLASSSFSLYHYYSSTAAATATASALISSGGNGGCSIGGNNNSRLLSIDNNNMPSM